MRVTMLKLNDRMPDGGGDMTDVFREPTHEMQVTPSGAVLVTNMSTGRTFLICDYQYAEVDSVELLSDYVRPREVIENPKKSKTDEPTATTPAVPKKVKEKKS